MKIKVSAESLELGKTKSLEGMESGDLFIEYTEDSCCIVQAVNETNYGTPSWDFITLGEKGIKRIDVNQLVNSKIVLIGIDSMDISVTLR